MLQVGFRARHRLGDVGNVHGPCATPGFGRGGGGADEAREAGGETLRGDEAHLAARAAEFARGGLLGAGDKGVGEKTRVADAHRRDDFGPALLIADHVGEARQAAQHRVRRIGHGLAKGNVAEGGHGSRKKLRKEN